MEGRKDDQGKVRMELLSSIALRKIAEVLTFGAKKYADENWRAGISYKRVIGACLRHLTAWKDGEDHDPETHLSHMAHAACCCMFLLEYEETRRPFDDRYKVGEQNEQKPDCDVRPGSPVVWVDGGIRVGHGGPQPSLPPHGERSGTDTHGASNNYSC